MIEQLFGVASTSPGFIALFHLGSSSSSQDAEMFQVEEGCIKVGETAEKELAWTKAPLKKGGMDGNGNDKYSTQIQFYVDPIPNSKGQRSLAT